MNTKLLAGLIPALGLSMGTMCSIMAENASADGATGGGSAAPPPVQITPVMPPPTPQPIPAPAATPAAAAQPQGQAFVTHEEYKKSLAEQQEFIRNELKILLQGITGQTPPAPPAPASAATTPPPAAPAAPPVPPQPQAPPPAPAPQPAQNLLSDPAFLSMQSKQEEALAAQKKLSDELAKMRAEKEAAEEKAKLVDTTLAVRKALENNTQYRLTSSAVTTAAEMLMLKGAIGRGADGKLYINLGTDGTPKHELLDKGVTAWLDTPDGVVFRQAVPAGMGFQGSAAGGVPHSFPQGVPGRSPKFSQSEFASSFAKATGK